jgi:hypothetical protein
MLYWHYRHAVEFSKNTRTPSPNTQKCQTIGASFHRTALCFKLLPQAGVLGSVRATRDRKNLAPF